MKALKELMNRLTAEGRDLSELKRMIDDLDAAGTMDEINYYEGQIYGVLVGLSIMGYITPEEADELQNSVEEDAVILSCTPGRGTAKPPQPRLQEEEP